jgi:hypothetical protein
MSINITNEREALRFEAPQFRPPDEFFSGGLKTHALKLHNTLAVFKKEDVTRIAALFNNMSHEFSQHFADTMRADAWVSCGEYFRAGGRINPEYVPNPLGAPSSTSSGVAAENAKAILQTVEHVKRSAFDMDKRFDQLCSWSHSHIDVLRANYDKMHMETDPLTVCEVLFKTRDEKAVSQTYQLWKSWLDPDKMDDGNDPVTIRFGNTVVVNVPQFRDPLLTQSILQLFAKTFYEDWRDLPDVLTRDQFLFFSAVRPVVSYVDGSVFIAFKISDYGVDQKFASDCVRSLRLPLHGVELMHSRVVVSDFGALSMYLLKNPGVSRALPTMDLDRLFTVPLSTVRYLYEGFARDLVVRDTNIVCNRQDFDHWAKSYNYDSAITRDCSEENRRIRNDAFEPSKYFMDPVPRQCAGVSLKLFNLFRLAGPSFAAKTVHLAGFGKGAYVKAAVSRYGDSAKYHCSEPKWDPGIYHAKVRTHGLNSCQYSDFRDVPRCDVEIFDVAVPTVKGVKYTRYEENAVLQRDILDRISTLRPHEFVMKCYVPFGEVTWEWCKHFSDSLAEYNVIATPAPRAHQHELWLHGTHVGADGFRLSDLCTLMTNQLTYWTVGVKFRHQVYHHPAAYAHSCSIAQAHMWRVVYSGSASVVVSQPAGIGVVDPVALSFYTNALVTRRLVKAVERSARHKGVAKIDVKEIDASKYDDFG